MVVVLADKKHIFSLSINILDSILDRIVLFFQQYEWPAGLEWEADH